MTKPSEFYRGGLDHKVVTAENGARVNSDFEAFITAGPWAEVKTWEVGPKIHAVTGYGLSNYTFIDGERGLILVDTGSSHGTGKEILKMKEAFSDKPIVAIIYTHHHYTAGTQAIVNTYPDQNIPIYGHPELDRNLFSVFSYTASGSFRRGDMQFGHFLPQEGPDAAYGIPEPVFDDSTLNARGHLPVTHPVRDGAEIEIDGVRVVFHHAISDTDDSLIIHFPELDAVVHNTAVMPFIFPMYTLRGDYYRSPPKILKSIDKLRALWPEYLLGCHGNPVIGKENVYNFSTAHRDALAFIYQQTIQGINMGLEPEDIARRVKLPDALTETPELFTAYVDVEHMVRGIYRGIIGWWGNDPADLHPPAADELGVEIVRGFGGADPLLDRAQQVMDEGRYNLAATLATYVLDENPEHARAKELKALALRKMAYTTRTGIQTRNFMLTEALRLDGEIEIDRGIGLAPSILSKDMIAAMPPETFLQSLTHTIDAEVASDLVVTLKIELSDIDRKFALYIRNGAVEFEAGAPKKHDLTLSMTVSQWADMAAGESRLSEFIASGDVKFSGDKSLQDTFLKAYSNVF